MAALELCLAYCLDLILGGGLKLCGKVVSSQSQTRENNNRSHLPHPVSFVNRVM